MHILWDTVPDVETKRVILTAMATADMAVAEQTLTREVLRWVQSLVRAAPLSAPCPAPADPRAPAGPGVLCQEREAGL